jgi:hypothetical protein
MMEDGWGPHILMIIFDIGLIILFLLVMCRIL